MLTRAKAALARQVPNILGWRTSRKIVVVESDDWGSIRMPSRKAYRALLNQGVAVDRCPFCRNDALATESDLSSLFEVLSSVNDSTGRPAGLTANVVVANPDFERITDSGFEHYSFKRIDRSFADTPGCERNLNLWEEGRKRRIFVMQSHGREHVNVPRWMRLLRDGDEETMMAFKLGVFGLSTTIARRPRKSLLAALDFSNDEEQSAASAATKEGLQMFKELFGYNSSSFIPPNYVWGRSLEADIATEGVRYIQGRFRHRYVGERWPHSRALGTRNEWGQLALVRNASFEPTLCPSEDCVDSCLSAVSTAFKWHKPAVICSHRVNFVGVLDSKNRDQNLRALSRLLTTIVRKWPQVEFMTSAELGDLIHD